MLTELMEGPAVRIETAPGWERRAYTPTNARASPGKATSYPTGAAATLRKPGAVASSELNSPVELARTVTLLTTPDSEVHTTTDALG
jgi:hypothetical protein